MKLSSWSHSFKTHCRLALGTDQEVEVQTLKARPKLQVQAVEAKAEVSLQPEGSRRNLN